MDLLKVVYKGDGISKQIARVNAECMQFVWLRELECLDKTPKTVSTQYHYTYRPGLGMQCEMEVAYEPE